MKRKYGFEVWIIIILLITSLILFGFYLVYHIYIVNRQYTLVLDPYTILDCENYKCENKSDKINEYNSKNYYVYIDNNYVGKNNLFYSSLDEKYYVFNEKNTNINEDFSSIFAYNGKANITLKDFNEENVTYQESADLSDLLNLQLEEENITKISINESNVDLYLINDNISMEEEIDDPLYFSALVYKFSGKYNILDKITSDNFTDVPYSRISNVIDIFDDGKLEFIYTKVYFDQIGSCHEIYRLKGKKFVKINECEIVR